MCRLDPGTTFQRADGVWHQPVIDPKTGDQFICAGTGARSSLATMSRRNLPTMAAALSVPGSFSRTSPSRITCRDSYNSTAHLNVDNDTGGMNRQQQRSDPVGVAMRFNTGRARYLELRDPCTGNKGTDKWPRAAVTECVPTAWGLAASPLVRLTPSLLEKAKNRSERRDILLACRKETRRTVMEKIVVCAAG